MKLIFMGTPEFAATSLRLLADSEHQILAVYTQPDRPTGRKRRMTPSAVKQVAEERKIPIYQPETLRNPEVINQLEELAPDVIVVVAYGKLLPKEILQIPPKGAVNVHGSLLPKYRGAAPIQRSVLNGDAVTGITTMYLAEGLDTGDMIYQEETAIGENETSSELFLRLAPIGASLLMKTLQAIDQGTAPRIPQREEESSYASVLTKEESPLSFNKPAQEVHNQIRGLCEWPGAVAPFHGKQCKIFRSRLVPDCFGPAGILLDDRRLIIGCRDGAVELLELQLAGAKRTSASDFINGHRMKKGDSFA